MSNPDQESPDRPLVFIPTYNEADNVVALCERIQAQGLGFDILFIDDNSPDGTGKVLDGLVAKYSNVKVLHRSGKLGIGSAHFQGIQWAYDHNYQTLITMDCDFTHPPEKLAEIISFRDKYDVVVGSRYLQKRSLRGWNALRKLLTRAGHALTVSLLGMPYDATGAFRLYRLDRIPRYAFDVIQSRGYSFFFESLYVLFVNRMKIGEFPLALPPRTYGHSKMSYREAVRSVKLLLTVYATKLLNPEKFSFCEPFSRDAAVPIDPQGWDDYWKNAKSGGGIVYDTIAAFYRKAIIRPTLNYFVRAYFPANARVLHAGCGSGQVDADIREHVKITGLDISVNALNLYRRNNKDHCEVKHGSIFEIPLGDGEVDGIHNLGVMEHFTPGEIRRILGEFSRVLKPGGRMIIFWPPEFGASVLFLKAVKGFLEKVLRRKNVKFHPDEITRVQSRRHAVHFFEESGFRVLRYYFGLKDFFTQCVIVVEKPTALALRSLPVDSGRTQNAARPVQQARPSFATP
ncbi:MAG TPA: glycosyltransferase [Candidatus Acidoferrum sp.]|jgi:dolichol-phosphate mannosyltransferase|nr:glycosyltransferase [Candidatus Acidoferrum sp.]